MHLGNREVGGGGGILLDSEINVINLKYIVFSEALKCTEKYVS